MLAHHLHTTSCDPRRVREEPTGGSQRGRRGQRQPGDGVHPPPPLPLPRGGAPRAHAAHSPALEAKTRPGPA